MCEYTQIKGTYLHYIYIYVYIYTMVIYIYVCVCASVFLMIFETQAGRPLTHIRLAPSVHAVLLQVWWAIVEIECCLHRNLCRVHLQKPHGAGPQ
jgi:hypothetical protein